MDTDWDEVTRTPFPAGKGSDRNLHVSAIAFDNAQELLWAGTSTGRVCSLLGPDLRQYTGFRICPPTEGPVHQFLFHAKGVLVLGTKSIQLARRQGPTIWTIRHANMVANRCMCFLSKAGNEILVAGWQSSMFVIDANKGEIVKEHQTDHHYSLMKSSRLICASTRTGTVNLLDPTTLKVIKEWKAHTQHVHDLDTQGDFVVTCGYSHKQLPTHAYMPDAYVNVFDVKNLVSISPIPFSPLAAHCRLHPRMLTTCIVMSQHGQMHVVDLLNPNTSNVKYANAQFVHLFEIAPSGEALAMVDREGIIHLWGSPTKIRFTEMGIAPEIPEQPDLGRPTMDWSPDTPLSTIGMPYYRETLFSALPPNLYSDVGAPPPRPIETSGLMKMDGGFYGKNTSGLRRNQYVDTRAAGKASNALQAPKFLSQIARESAMSSGLSAAAEVRAEQEADTPSSDIPEYRRPEAPALYQNLEIKYSKFGVDDFDFAYYNKTDYAGLENHITNSYANPLLQLMHYTPLLRNLALQHAATACLVDPCMLCELGYVFDMLQKAEGSTCHATNLFKALAAYPQARQMSLLEKEVPSPAPTQPLTAMVQGLCRFLLDKMTEEYRSIPAASTALERGLFNLSPQPNPEELVSKVLATSAVIDIKCMNCKNQSTKDGNTHIVELMYPPPPPRQPRGGRVPKVTFSQVLKTGVEREHSTKGWCNKCNRYQALQMRKTVRSVPAVLAINTAISNQEHRRLWAQDGWLPEEIGVIVNNGSFYCYEGDDLKLHLQRGTYNVVVYALVGTVVNVERTAPHKPHLVATVNVAHSEPNPSTESKWHLFNDFSVKAISTAEALTFNQAWKMPSVLVYQVKKASHLSSTEWKTNLDTSILYQNHVAEVDQATCRVLDQQTEKPGPKTVVALDTEFVSLKQPEIQMNSDGERETIRPVTHALARVSLLRGLGDEQEGDAFIDDYIMIKEPVVDYLTEYSGITPDDLDPRKSKHNLVSLKVAYKKLWVLLNLGCKFLGHGLKQDFRVINIQIPRAQVIDTIELFYLPSRLRKLSLAFLSWYLLKEKIQKVTHDSIEDARTALKLYRKFQEYQDAGILEQMLEDIYKVGRNFGFKAPKGVDSAVQRTETPPMPQESAATTTTTTTGEESGTPGPSTPLRKAQGTGGNGSGIGSGAFTVPSLTPSRNSPRE